MIFNGTLINIALIIAGSITGIILKNKFTDRFRDILFQITGLVTIFLGIQMALKIENLIIIVFSLIIGGLLGESLNLDVKVENVADRIKKRFSTNTHHGFTEGFITATLIYCIGSMAILGSIDSGLRNDHTILITKGILDGFMSIVLASTFGIGVAFSIIPLAIYQGGITILAFVSEKFFTPFLINQLTGTGGILIIGLGFVLLNIKKIKIMNLSPSLVFTLLIGWVYQYIVAISHL